MTSRKTLDWKDFLALMRGGLDVFRQRVERIQANPEQASPVIYNPSATQADADQILVGVGSWREQHEGICLNNKGVAARLDQPVFFDSVTSMVLADHAVLWADWKKAIGEDFQPGLFFERFQLHVEDASPDSCFGLLVLLARLNGVDPSEIPKEWADYMRRWEAGDVTSTGPPEQSYGALHNALGHSQAGVAWATAWSQCLEFLVNALELDVNPVDIGEHGGRWPSLAHARALMTFERQVYEDSLTYATTLQLRLPIRGTKYRYRLVDAYIAEEHQPLGMAKVFLRNDSEHPFLEVGFTLMAIYKPGESGSGNDMSISLMTGRGVHLQDLWEELERRENEAWQGQRPCDAPRIGGSLYVDGKDRDGKPAPNEPWHINVGMDLIAAPKALKVDASLKASMPEKFIVNGKPDSNGKITVLGSRLSWDDVCEALWFCYQPFQDFWILSRDNKLVTLAECKPEPEDDERVVAAGKHLIKATWYNPGAHSEAHPCDETEPDTCDTYQHQAYIRFTPTLKRYMAACIDCAETNEVTLKDLPQQDNYDFIELSGGFAVVARAGAFVVDDWRLDPLSFDDIRAEYANICKRLSVIRKMRDEIKGLYEDIEKELKAGLRGRKVPKLVNRLAAMKLEVGKCWTDTMPKSFEPGIITFREALENRFGISGRLQSFYSSVDRIGSMLGNYIDLRTNRRVAFLSLYGFPVVLVASFFSGILGRIDHPLVPWPLAPLGLFVAFSLIGILIVLMGNKLFDRQTRLKKSDYRSSKKDK